MRLRQDIPGYTPSPLEAAFEGQMLSRLGTALEAPYVGRSGNAVRLSRPRLIGDQVVALQYSRFPLFSTDVDRTTDVLAPLNPKLVAELGQKSEVDEDDWLESKAADMDYNNRFVDLLYERIVARDGAIDKVRGLTDPTYYTEGAPVNQWGELYQFAVLDVRNGSHDFTRPHMIERRGQYGGNRPDVYGRLYVPAQFGGTGHSQEELALNVTFPRTEYMVTEAYVAAFTNDKVENIRDVKTGLDLDDYEFFERRPKISIPLFVDTGHRDTAEVMNGVGTFVEKLIIAKR